VRLAAHFGWLASALAFALILTFDVGPVVAGPGSKLDPPFIAKANTVCKSVSASFRQVLGKTFPYPNFNPEKPDPVTLRLVGAHFHKALSIYKAVPGELKALGEPTTGRQLWLELRGLADEDETLAIEQQADALAGNAKAFVANVNAVNKLQSKIDSTGAAAGFAASSACASTF